MSVALQEARSKFCAGCGNVLPMDQFHRKRADSEDRRAECRRCLAKQRNYYNRERRRRGVIDFAKKVVACERDANKLIHLTGQLFTHFGDYSGVARHFKAAFDGASAAGRHMTATKILLAILDLAVVTDQLRQRSLQRMSDEELAVAHEHAMLRLVRERPNMVLAAAKLTGWTLVPPSQEDVSSPA